ncbi:hypothetical protein KWG16_12130 [Acinetobacter baumannii]
MNENAELIKYLDIAENVYENMYEKYQITDNPVTNLNRVMAEMALLHKPISKGLFHNIIFK